MERLILIYTSTSPGSRSTAAAENLHREVDDGALPR